MIYKGQQQARSNAQPDARRSSRGWIYTNWVTSSPNGAALLYGDGNLTSPSLAAAAVRPVLRVRSPDPVVPH